MKTVIRIMAVTAVIAVALSLGAVLGDRPSAGGRGRELCFELVDGTVITGRLESNVITIRISSGNVLKVPAAALTELTVGLNDHPKLVQGVETLVKALDSAETRQGALRKLIALGPAVAPIVKRHAAGDVSARHTAVAEILAAYESWSTIHPDAPEALARPLEPRSKVRAGHNTFLGTVTVRQFKIASPYGSAIVKLDELRRIGPAARAARSKRGRWGVELRDKTRVEGTAISGSLQARTRYGTMVVPCGQIQRATIAADGKSIRLQCHNADRIAGTFEPKATISLKTDKGRAEMPTGKIAVVVYSPVALDLGIINGVTMKLVRIEAGTFMMGSKLPAEEVAKRFGTPVKFAKNEHPRHRITLSKPFYMGVTEVTQAQWKAVMNTQPWKRYQEAGDSYPASHISWDAARACCMALSKKTGRTVRLPTEAEWEYACRAGTTTVYSFGDDSSKLGDYAWYRGNAYDKGEKYAHRVGVKKPNAWGLYDMHGNMWEWCADRYADSYTNANARDPKGPAAGGGRVLRGGAWLYKLGFCRAARRDWEHPHMGLSYRGFRVVVESGLGVN